MSRGCTGEATPARAAQNQKQQVALRCFCALGEKPAGQHMTAPCWHLTPGIQPIQVLPVPEILQHLAGRNTSCLGALFFPCQHTFKNPSKRNVHEKVPCYILINPKLTPKLNQNRREAYSAGQLI